MTHRASPGRSCTQALAEARWQLSNRANHDPKGWPHPRPATALPGLLPPDGLKAAQRLCGERAWGQWAARACPGTHPTCQLRELSGETVPTW